MNDEAVYRTAPATPGLLKIKAGVIYVKWVGVLNKYTAATADKLSALGSTPLDMQWAENCQTKYTTARNEMQCG